MPALTLALVLDLPIALAKSLTRASALTLAPVSVQVRMQVGIKSSSLAQTCIEHYRI